MEELDRTFRPEFLNRIDQVILFGSLSRADLKEIVKIQIRHLRELLDEQQVDVQLTDEAMAFLADEGYDPAFGARPLKRTIQRELQDPLAMAVLDGRFATGDTVYVDVDPDGRGLQFSRTPQRVAAVAA
jgi:ATP-dependent Clp protease ATP-binding subunit ClpB